MSLAQKRPKGNKDGQYFAKVFRGPICTKCIRRIVPGSIAHPPVLSDSLVRQRLGPAIVETHPWCMYEASVLVRARVRRNRCERERSSKIES
jgi:hypothetical protein